MSRARTFADLATTYDGDSLYSPNMAINGDMSVAQRGTSSTGQSSSGIKCVDQYHYLHNGGGTADISQSTTVPVGFKNSLKVECNAADSDLGAGEFSGIRQHIEAQHCQKLLFGTASAKAVTISFHVRSKQTGTYALNLFLDDDTIQFTKTYTISSADTFEKKTITFPANTSAVIEDDTGKGIEFTWWLRAGSTYTGGSAMSGYEAYSNGDAAVGHAVDFLDNAANEFYLTGVQVEIGEVATPFKYETFEENVRRCQRYFRQIGTIRHQGANGDPVGQTIPFEPTMRAEPTVAATNSTGGSHSIAGTGDFPNTQMIYSGTAATSGSTAFIQFTGATASAELA
tara:strand:- start:530 stop:1555 length:1026 start_codon:yes stop_codon:yes gene_type:complete